jgi:class 3 adenylate cyclase
MNTSEIFVFINKIFNILVPIINEQGGVVERYNNSGLISLFPTNLSDSVKSAIKMREYIRNDKDEKIRNVDLGFVINKEDIMVGIIGCEERFGASVVSDYLTIVESLNEFGKKYGTSILVTENSVAEAEEYGESYNYRKLGYIKYKSKDQVIALYDFFDGDDYNIIARKKQTKDIFEQAVKAYYNRDFYNARQMFIQVLKQFQEDKASKEYLRLCDKYYKFKEYENIDIWLDLF